jgi:hypothetical protein
LPSRGDPQVGIFDGESLFQRNHNAVARLAADHPSDVAMTSGIFRKHDVARPESPDRAVARLNFNLASKGNNILAPWCRVIIAPMGCRHAPKEHPIRGLELGNFHMSTQVKLDVDFFEVRFIIRAGVKSNDLHVTGLGELTGKSKAEKKGNRRSKHSSRSSRSKCLNHGAYALYLGVQNGL